jgi:hypothetical protein
VHVIFVYGSERLKEMWRACGGVVVLEELDASRIPSPLQRTPEGAQLPHMAAVFNSIKL